MKDNDEFIVPEYIFLQKIEELGKFWVFNTDSGEHYTLNKTAYWILEHIADGMTSQDIMKDFFEVFHVGEKQGKRDFNEIIKNFLDEGIIKRRGK